MECPRCHGEMLDQRATKTGRQPDYQCANERCVNDKGFRTGVWLKAKAAPQAPQTGYAQAMVPKQPITERPAALRESGDPMPWETSPKDEKLVTLYWACFDEILAGLKTRALKDGFPGEQIAAMTSTLYIARSRAL